jgi:hypothetical protein
MFYLCNGKAVSFLWCRNKFYTRWSNRLCALDDGIVIIRGKEKFWSPCILCSWICHFILKSKVTAPIVTAASVRILFAGLLNDSLWASGSSCDTGRLCQRVCVIFLLSSAHYDFQPIIRYQTFSVVPCRSYRQPNCPLLSSPLLCCLLPAQKTRISHYFVVFISHTFTVATRVRLSEGRADTAR